jgi:hypothetical protein
MTESEVRAALCELGNKPRRRLVEHWLRAAEAELAQRRRSDTGAEECVTNPSTTQHAQTPTSERTQPCSKSRLEPMLCEHGTLVKAHGRRKPGRPRMVASWFPAVARTMADGTTLGMALAINGIKNLSKSETRACYRNRTFQALYREARPVFLAEHYGRKPTLRGRMSHYL